MSRPARSTDKPLRPGKRMAGFTIVEVMIALTIGLIVSGAVLYVYVGVAGTYGTHRAMARLQENVRFAYEHFSREIRMAGSDACGAASQANVLAAASPYTDLYGGGLGGYEAGAGLPVEVVDELANRDAIAIIRTDNSSSLGISNHNPASAQFDLVGNTSDLQEGEILVVCSADGSHSAVFQMTGPNQANPGNVVHNTGVSGVSPGNCSKALGTPIPSPCNASTPANQGTAYTFPNGSRLMRLSGTIYFIRNNPAGIPSLYWQKLTVASGSASSAAEELVEGVEDMQITYGIDNDSGNDTAQKGLHVDAYVTADAVTDWARVVSVKMSLLFQTAENNVAKAPQTYTYNGSTVTPTDRRIRKVATHVVRVRNR